MPPKLSGKADDVLRDRMVEAEAVDYGGGNNRFLPLSKNSVFLLCQAAAELAEQFGEKGTFEGHEKLP